MFSPRFQRGYTMLEIILALVIALLVLAVAVPSVMTALNNPPSQQSFEEFDAMVQEARRRSVTEERPYILVWGREKEVVLRPKSAANPDEARGIQRWSFAEKGALELHLPAALMPHGATPEAIWTFWPDGVCEPAEIRHAGDGWKWIAVYHPLTGRAEVRYE